MDTINQIKNQIKVVRDVREQAQQAVASKATLLARFESKNKELFELVANTTQARDEEEGKLRELTLRAYTETGNKSPVIGVGIREMTRLEYDTKVAFNWAMEHKIALKLDSSAFGKIAKSSNLEFVKIYLEPQATIATQLGEDE